MTERQHAAPRHVAFINASASRAEALLARAAIEGVADAMRRARGAGPPDRGLRLVARARALRAHRDLVTALAAEGVPAPRARDLAPHLARALGSAGPDAWVSLTSTHGVPVEEHAMVLRVGEAAVQVAAALSTPHAEACAVVHLEPRERSPAGPWLGVLAAGTRLFRMAEPDTRALLGEVRDRLVAARPGVRAWPPACGATGATVALRTPAGALNLLPFLVTDAATRAELERLVLPDVALPAPVLPGPIG